MVNDQIRRAKGMNNSELYNYAKELSAPYELLKQVAEQGRLPVVMFSAGGIATPADAAVSCCFVCELGPALTLFLNQLMMQLGCDGVFVYVCCLASDDLRLTPVLSPQWIGHLQVVRPGRARPRDCHRHHQLQRRQHPGRGVNRPRTRYEGREQPQDPGQGDDRGPWILNF